MKVSLITATYNSEKTLASCLDSVANQSYRDIEHIVIDGLSTDDTVALAQRYPHVTKILSEQDAGIYDAMNKGLALASGDIVGIINSDDFYAADDVIAQVVQVFKEHQCGALYADLDYVDPVDTAKVVRRWRSGSYARSKFLWGWMPPHPTFFVKKEYYDSLGAFNLDMGSAADYELMLRFLYKNRIPVQYLRATTVKMRTGGASNVSWSARLQANASDRRAWRSNDIKPYFFTTFLKPIRKIGQYLIT